MVRTICLVGFMGAGKSTVGLALSRRLGWAFIDLDEHIQTHEGRTIDEIFRKSGEAEFRRAEHMALQKLLKEQNPLPRVVALGGGAFVQAENATLLEKAKVPTVFLDAPVDELFQRCQTQGLNRPLRRDREQFRQLHETRRTGYMTASLRIETSGKDVDNVAAEIAGVLGLGSSE